MMPSKLRVAVVQTCAGVEKEENLTKAERFVTEAVTDGGAQLVALSEVFAWRGPPPQEAEAAEPLDGALVRRMAALAKKHGIWLLLGSLLEKVEGVRPYNTSLLLGPAGDTLATYRKIHLFDVNVPGQQAVQESATRTPGDAAVSVALSGPAEGVRLGLSVCYDLRFPELYRRLMQAGANVLCVPAAFTARTGRDHWLPLLQARAIENLSYVIAPNQWGVGGERMDTYGRSLILDPWGTVLASCPDGEGWAAATLDFERQASMRRSFPALDHIRKDIFFP
jgi:predicted amidohydrolase